MPLLPPVTNTTFPFTEKRFVNSKELIMCVAGSGVKGEIVRYAYYRIGWNMS